MENVKNLINEIHQGLSQASASQKDEVRMMKAMLNDETFIVDVYGNEGKVSSYSPYADARSMVSNIISTTTKISKAEADDLAANYEFKKSDAESLVGISKEFINTYLTTGRKLSLGGREKSNISLTEKKIEETIRMYPKKVGVNSDGSDRYEKVQTKVPAYNSIKVIAPCPKWVK